MKKLTLFLFLNLILNLNLYAQFGDKTGTSGMSDMAALNVISVTIGGDFIVDGTFPAMATERVDAFVTRMFNEYKSAALSVARDKETLYRIEDEIGDYAQRDILLKRFDGKEVKLDLMKFRLSGNFNENPYLKNGDVLIFPALDLEKNFISIMGAVHKHVVFQYLEGDSLSDALFFARGINPVYENVTTAEISRLSYDGNSEEIIKVNINDNIELKRGDRINIVAGENFRKNYRVLVLGEVVNPGYVYITKDSTTVVEAIEKTGGLLKNASLTDAALLRDYTSFQTLQNYVIRTKAKNRDVLVDPKDLQDLYLRTIEELRMYRMSNLTEEDTAFFNVDNKLRIFDNDTYLDMTKIYNSGTEESNFIVQDNDVIIVPKMNEYVYLFGQIRNPGNVKFQEGEDYRYYISKAGGLGDYAWDEEDVVVIKGKTKNWVYVSDPELTIEPGDYIYIPKDPPRTFDFYLKRVGSIASIVGSVATVILLLAQLGK